MKALGYAVIMLFCFVVTGRAAAVYSGCDSPPSTFRHVWYFDPVHGKTPAAGGNGSQAAPWNSLQALVQTQPGYSFPLLTSAPYRWVPVAGKAAVVAPGPSAGPVAPGDEVLLMSGNYGDIWLSTNGALISNSAFVTIQAAPGQTPVLTSLYLAGTNDWAFNGLKVQSLGPASLSGNALVSVKDGGAGYPTSNIVFQNMSISSQDDAEAWSQAQWVTNARSGFWIQATAGGAYTKCIALTGSHITNVRYGASLTADQTLFSNNQIDHFGDDGIEYGASNLAITHNNIHDNLDIGDGNHEDAMQGIAGVLPAGASVNHYQNILIDSNLIIRQTDPELSFPTYLQGIDAFDGDWTNMTVTNNVIVTGSCYAIGLASLHNSLVANNTGLEDGLVVLPGCTASINIGGQTHEGPPTSNTRVTNNLAEHYFINDQNQPTLTFDHNVALYSYQPFVHWNGGWTYSYPAGTDANGNKAFATTVPKPSQFLAWNPNALSFNLMLKAGAVAIGAGTATGAPTLDILGATRAAPFTAGAYAYPY
jgi:Right handed beta helix region